MTRTEILQIAKPILFNDVMVRAILDGIKTETRRIVKGAPKNAYRVESVDVFGDGTIPLWDFLYGVPLAGGGRAEMFETIKAPYKRGDYLYVRETWNGLPAIGIFPAEFWYKADEKMLNPDDKWRPSIHMPKEAARIFLRVKDVRPEKLQDITEEGAKAEGICEEWARAWWKPTYYDPDSGGDAEYRGTFAYDLWDSTIKPKDRGKYGWEANPWVWVIEFEKVEVGF